MNTILNLIQIINENLYLPLKEALYEYDFMSQQFYANGIFTTWGDVISMTITLLFGFFVLFIPIKLVYKVVKRMLP